MNNYDKTNLEYVKTVNSLRRSDRPYCPETICANICYDVSGSASRLKLITYIDPKSKIGVVDWQCYQCGYQAPLHRHSWQKNAVVKAINEVWTTSLTDENKSLIAEVKRLRQVLEANLLVECDGCKNWLIEEQIMQHPHHTQWGWVCYSCSKLRESDEE